jgi:hypothetical protein
MGGLRRAVKYDVLSLNYFRDELLIGHAATNKFDFVPNVVEVVGLCSEMRFERIKNGDFAVRLSETIADQIRAQKTGSPYNKNFHFGTLSFIQYSTVRKTPSSKDTSGRQFDAWRNPVVSATKFRASMGD